jgi:tetratricopeptide (TPR) repeat protein
VAFLCGRTGEDGAAADELADTLGDLPLALEQAAAYLEETGTSVRDYLRLLGERAGEVLGLGELTDHWAAIAVQLVWAACPPDADDPATYPTCARLLPHALAATNHASRLAADPEATAGLLTPMGAYLWRRVEPEQARQLFEHALTILEAQLGPDHPDVARSLNNIGNALRARGELPAARTRYERALTIFAARVGPDHLDMGRALNNLAAALGGLGELPMARDTHVRAQAILEARLEPDHPHRAHAMSSLGSVAYQHGDLATARAYYQRALDSYQARLGADHPDAASTLANLATVLRDLGDLPAARAALTRALASSRRGSGPTIQTSPKPGPASRSWPASSARRPAVTRRPRAPCRCLRLGLAPGTRYPP